MKKIKFSCCTRLVGLHVINSICIVKINLFGRKFEMCLLLRRGEINSSVPILVLFVLYPKTGVFFNNFFLFWP